MATGRGLRTPARYGWCPIMMAGAITKVIGKAAAGVWPMIIIGIAAGIETIAAMSTTETGAKAVSGEVFLESRRFLDHPATQISF